MKRKDLPILLTPLILAVNPVQVEAGEIAASYSHETQMTGYSGSNTSSTLATSTYSGTQTFDFQGRPWDSDNDSDADPY
jgi:hypothetical protein